MEDGREWKLFIRGENMPGRVGVKSQKAYNREKEIREPIRQLQEEEDDGVGQVAVWCERRRVTLERKNADELDEENQQGGGGEMSEKAGADEMYKKMEGKLIEE